MSNNKEPFIKFQGVLNFRDMGGYDTHNGKRVKKNLFFRSANLSNMTDADRTTFQRLGIKTIFDYRDDHEAENNPTPLLDGVQNIRIPAKGAAAFKIPSMTKSEKLNSNFYEQINKKSFANFYAQMPFDNPSFKSLMDIVKDGENFGLLHHCAVGKDRTGVGGALILTLLDVPREKIMEDYLLTNGQLTPIISRMEQNLKMTYPEMDLGIFHEIMMADETYLTAVFNEIDRRYESTNDFLYDQFDITKQLRAELQAKYVE